MAKHKKNDKIVSDYSSQKRKHLERLATQLLKQDEINQKLKEKQIDPNILNLF